MVWRTVDNSRIAEYLDLNNMNMVPGEFQSPDNSGLAEERKRNQGNEEYKQVAISIIRTTFEDKLVLTLNLKDIRAFQNLLMMI